MAKTASSRIKTPLPPQDVSKQNSGESTFRPRIAFPLPAADRTLKTGCRAALTPLRFIWQTDANGRFTLGSSEFTEVLGPYVAAALGRSWSDIAAELGVDPKGEIAAAIGTHNTWSGITVPRPADDPRRAAAG